MTPREPAGRVLLVEDSEGGAQLMRIAFGERLPDAVLEVYPDGERALDELTEGRLADWDLDDVTRSYDLGADSPIAKPHSLDALFEIVEALGRYRLSVVSLPG